MQLGEALAQIGEIRSQMERVQAFRGYRSETVAASGLFALLAGLVQWTWIPAPATDFGRYLFVWLAAAMLSIVVAGGGIVRRYSLATSSERARTRQAVAQFWPTLLVGGLTTAVIARSLPRALSMLPGLWMILFSLGVFASSSVLPRAVRWVGVFYVLCGLVALGLADSSWALHPCVMALPFAIGQFSSALILYWNLERGDDNSLESNDEQRHGLP